MDEDSIRTKTNKRGEKKTKGDVDGATLVFDYGQILVNDNIKVELFKNLVEGYAHSPRHQAIEISVQVFHTTRN